MDQIQNKFKILSNEKVCPQFLRLRIDAKSILKKIQPGQFIHIRVNAGIEPLFRRPFSVFRAQKSVDILYDVVGKGTSILASRQKGDELDVLGPLGNTFSMPTGEIENVVMIAGGIGVAPFLVLSDILKKNKKLKMTLLYGGRTGGHVFNLKEFKENGCKVYVATDDGSIGTKGRVSKLFSRIPENPETTLLYTCGPRPMMAAVQAFAKKRGLRGEAACEEVMACGLGACLGCAIKTTKGYKTVCHDGPVFDLQEIVFETGLKTSYKAQDV